MNEGLTIGILGMPDNAGTRDFTQSLLADGVNVDFIIYWRPNLKQNFRRAWRKVKADGVAATLQRIFFAVGTRLAPNQTKVAQDSASIFYVDSHNGPDCHNILKARNVDVLLLMTDCIIKSTILKIPNVATLNAHPGWIPKYRGLDAIFHQLNDGILPSVSVHLADEGIDTGPVLDRQYLETDNAIGLDEIMCSVEKLQWKLMADVIKRIATCGDIVAIDTFQEPSNMYQGSSPRFKRRLDYRLRSQKIKLERL